MLLPAVAAQPQGIKAVALYGDMNTANTSGPGGAGPSTSTGTPLAAAAPPLSSPGSRPTTGRRNNNPEHNRSSIIFG